MKKLNKKGLLGGLLPDLSTAMKSALDLIPNWLKFVIFFALFISLGSLFESSLQLFGYFCDSQDNLVRTEFNFITNMQLLQNKPEVELLSTKGMLTEEFGISSISEEISGCSRNIRFAELRYENETENRNLTGGAPEWFYDGGFCANCSKYVWITEWNDATFQFRASSEKKWCEGDAYINYDKNFIQELFCACEPPNHYFYNQSANIYSCLDYTCKNVTIAMIWDDQLSKAGGEVIKQENETDMVNKDYNHVFEIKCMDFKFRPSITIFGIKLFNYQYWVLGLVLLFLIWAIKNFL